MDYRIILLLLVSGIIGFIYSMWKEYNDIKNKLQDQVNQSKKN